MVSVVPKNTPFRQATCSEPLQWADCTQRSSTSYNSDAWTQSYFC